MKNGRYLVRHAYLNQWHPVSPKTFGQQAHSTPLVPILASILVSMVMSVTALMAIAVVALIALYLNFTKDLPSTDKLAKTDLFQSTRIYDRNGDLLFELFDPHDGRRTLVSIDQVPEVVKQSTIATEDPTFYSNQGIDVQAILRALYQNWRYKSTISGASTITQQVVKNYLVGDDPTIDRKIREALTAVEVNRRYTKDEILTLYLNTNNYGNLSYGIGAAARGYFNKDVSQLNLAEASLLAGLPQSPAVYDPCQNPDGALERQGIVLNLMEKAGYIESDEADSAARETAAYLKTDAFFLNCNIKTSLKAPHFVNYVRADLEKRFGMDIVYKGGLQVYTTFDPKVQAIVEEEARKQIEKLKDQHVTNSAVVVERVDDGEIYAMLGSVNFFDKSIDGQVNVADRLRQPGSSIKPVNYVTAFKYGWTPATRILDVKTKFPSGDGKPYIPNNYDEREHGVVSVRTALGSSLNIPAVKTLYFTSTKDPRAPATLAMMQTARNTGITTFFNDDGSPKPFGLALTLGGGEVKLIELTSAYSVFARQGAVIPSTPYLKIVDGKGQVLYDLKGKDKPQPRCPLFDLQAPNEQPDANGFCAKSAPYAYQITNILSDDRARIIGFGLNSLLKTSYPSAVKTGTTNDFRDNWTLGFTTDWVVGVWVGNADNSAMIHSTGITGAAPIWRQVMDRIMNGNPGKAFPVPPGIVNEGGEVYVAGKPRIAGENTNQQKIVIDTRNGLLAGPDCPKQFTAEVMIAGGPATGSAAPVNDVPKQYSPLCPNKDTAHNDNNDNNPSSPDTHNTSNNNPGNPSAPGQPQSSGGGADVTGNISTGDNGASIWGRVLHANGKPAGGVTVVVSGPSGSRSASTSPEGYFNFDELIPGTYGVSARGGGGLSAYVENRRRAVVNLYVP